MKFIHVSDVHLGIKPDEGKPWSEKRAQDIWDSFAEVIGAAVELKPDFLLISGDLFHAQPLKKELRYLRVKLLAQGDWRTGLRFNHSGGFVEDQHSFGTWRRSAAYSIPSEAYSGKWV